MSSSILPPHRNLSAEAQLRRVGALPIERSQEGQHRRPRSLRARLAAAAELSHQEGLFHSQLGRTRRRAAEDAFYAQLTVDRKVVALGRRRVAQRRLRKPPPGQLKFDLWGTSDETQAAARHGATV